MGTGVRERVWSKAKNGLEASSDGWTAGMSGPGTTASHGRVFLWQRKVIWWRHVLFGADGNSGFKSLGSSRLEYKLVLKKLDWYKSNVLFFALLMHSGFSQKPSAGSADYEESRCSSEIRINVCLTVRWDSPCLFFILPSICQRQSVNYCFIYFITSVWMSERVASLTRWKEKILFSCFSYLSLIPSTTRSVFFFFCTCSSSLVSSLNIIRSCTPGSSFATAPSSRNPCLWPHLEQDTKPDH